MGRLTGEKAFGVVPEKTRNINRGKDTQTLERCKCLRDKNENECVGDKVVLPFVRFNYEGKHCFFMELCCTVVQKCPNPFHRNRSFLFFSFLCNYSSWTFHQHIFWQNILKGGCQGGNDLVSVGI